MNEWSGRLLRRRRADAFRHARRTFVTPASLATLLVVAACSANAPMPTGSTAASGTERPTSGFQGTTCAEVAAEFAGELVGRLENLVANASDDVLHARVEKSTDSLAAGVLDHLFEKDLGGRCRVGEFADAVNDRLPGDVYAAIEAAGYSLYDRLAIPLSALELDERVERRPPVPIRPVPEFGGGPWGPLAVVQATADDGDLAAMSGALLIGDSCVTVGGSVMVFRSAQVRWNADRETITFWDPLGEVAVELRHGDHVRFGGGEFGVAVDWASEPDPACSLTGSFSVHSLGELNGVRIRELAGG